MEGAWLERAALTIVASVGAAARRGPDRKGEQRRSGLPAPGARARCEVGGQWEACGWCGECGCGATQRAEVGTAESPGGKVGWARRGGWFEKPSAGRATQWQGGAELVGRCAWLGGLVVRLAACGVGEVGCARGGAVKRRGGRLAGCGVPCWRAERPGAAGPTFGADLARANCSSWNTARLPR